MTELGREVFLPFMGEAGTVTQVITDQYGIPIGYVVDVESQGEDVFRNDEVEDFDATKKRIADAVAVTATMR